MIGLGALAFASPWILAALATLPLLWWLLRITPPAPRRQVFPAIRLLLGLRPDSETPAHTPWWLLALRLLIAGLVIVALARPLLDPSRTMQGEDALLVVVDNDWASAPRWPERQEALRALLEEAQRRDVPAAVVPAAPDPLQPDGPTIALQDPGALLRSLATLQPRPWTLDRAALATRLGAQSLARSARVVWLSDGLDAPGTPALLDQLRRFGPLTVYADDPAELPLLLRPPAALQSDLVVKVERPAAEDGRQVRVDATDGTGGAVASAEASFAPGEREADATFRLPLELRNRIERLTLAGQASAGATVLLDERWRRRPVGLVAGGAAAEQQPLLSDLYYLQRALEPFAEVRRGDLGTLLDQPLAVLVLADVGALPAAQAEALSAWVQKGGLLLRFAGPRLAEAQDSLLPVRLRSGGRTLGGALAWDQPAHLAPFPQTGPFAGLQPPAEVTVSRQVLAEPSLDLADKTWARLADGTPLVTAESRGDGWLVLVHTTANNDWSDLALSGLFVEMMQRLVALSAGVTAASDRPLAPWRVLDGAGRLQPAPATVMPLPPGDGEIGPTLPPGIYGNEGERRALNLGAGLVLPAPLGDLPLGIGERRYGGAAETPLAPWLLAAALLLLIADLAVALLLRGLVGRRPAAGPVATALAAALLLIAPLGEARAQTVVQQGQVPEAALETRLAYVMTGDTGVDRLSEAGLTGLTEMLTRRTAVEPGPPQGVRPGQDDLAFYPLLYWPVTPGQRPLSAAGRQALDDYMRFGGTLLIDLLQPDRGGRLGSSGGLLQSLTEGMAIPPLEPIGPEHVLTRSFYLLQDFPGRYSGGTLWVERTVETRNDGVASLIVGSNDWAAAWAVDEAGRPLAAVVPGGERQREMAFRFGINLVMYALTGNYKADQVHVPFILERLGQ